VREIGTKKAEDMIGEAYEEHHVVKSLSPSSRTWTRRPRTSAKMTVLKELVGHHVEEEEDEMFPMAEKSSERIGAPSWRRKWRAPGPPDRFALEIV
jgi:hypothetical protein